MLFPHVIATPDYVKNPYFDRAWPQNLYINPESPLIHKLRFPPGFNNTITPLVTFRRVDLLLEQGELVELHRALYDPPEDFSLFSEEQAWNLSPDYYLQLFAAPLPEANYGSMILSTGGHWTTTLLSGYRDESKEEQGFGIDGVVRFFREAMSFWANQVQSGVRSMGGQVLANGKRGRRQVVVRAYLPGHEDCHKAQEPWTEIQPWIWKWFNWANIEEYNQVFQVCLPNSTFLKGIRRPVEHTVASVTLLKLDRLNTFWFSKGFQLIYFVTHDRTYFRTHNTLTYISFLLIDRHVCALMR